MPQIELLRVNQYVYLFKLRVEFLCRMKIVIVETAAAAVVAIVVVVVVVVLLYCVYWFFILLCAQCSHCAQLRSHLIRCCCCCCVCIIRFKPRWNNTHTCAECDRFIFYLLFSFTLRVSYLVPYSVLSLSVTRAFTMATTKRTKELILYEKNKYHQTNWVQRPRVRARERQRETFIWKLSHYKFTLGFLYINEQEHKLKRFSQFYFYRCEIGPFPNDFQLIKWDHSE